MKSKKEFRPLSVEDIKYIYSSWMTKSNSEIAEALGRPESTISYVAAHIRKLGVELPRRRTAIRTKEVMMSALKELGLIKDR